MLPYIRGSWGNKGTPVTPEQASVLREKTKSHSDPWQWTELGKIPERIERDFFSWLVASQSGCSGT